MNKFALKKEFYSSLNLIKKISNGDYTRLTKTASGKITIYEKRVKEAYALLSKADQISKKIESKRPRYEYLLTEESSREIKDIIPKLNSLGNTLLALSSVLTKPEQSGSKKQMKRLSQDLKNGVSRIIARTGNGLGELSQLNRGATNSADASKYSGLYDKLNSLIKEYEAMRSGESSSTSSEDVDQLLAELEASNQDLSSRKPTQMPPPESIPDWAYQPPPPREDPFASLKADISRTYQRSQPMTQDQAESQLRQTGGRFVDSLDDTSTRSSGSIPGPVTR